MGGGANAHTLGDGVGDAEDLADELGKDVPQHTGDDDDHHRQGLDAPQLLRHADADGGGDGLGQKGHIHGVVQVEEDAHGQDHGQAGQHAGGDTQQDGLGVLLQQGELLVEGNGQADRGRGQQEADVPGPFHIGGVVDFKPYQEGHHQDDGHQQGVKEGKLPPASEENAHAVGRQR